MSSGCGKRTQEDVGKLVESWRKMAGWTQEKNGKILLDCQ